jgi:O-succinylbenzoic acid--CoA ligase
MSIRDEIKLVHPFFSIKGVVVGEEGLNQVAYSYVKEGSDFEKEIGLFLLDWLTDKHTVTVMTSGTTGEPKKMEIKKKAMYASAMATADYFNLSQNAKVLHCLPCQYIAGKMMLVRALVLGLNIHFVAPSAKPLENTSEVFDFCAMVPMQVASSLDKLNQSHKIIIGGAPLSEELEEAIVDHIDPIHTRVFQTFGMTETLSHIGVRPISKEGLKQQKYMTVKGVKISTDGRGCLVVTAPELVAEPIVTNDLVTIHHDFSFTWLGRVDHLVNSGGIKLIPENIEKKIKDIVKGSFFLTGIPDEKLGEKLVMIVEEEQAPDLLEEIKNTKVIEKYQTPKEVIQIPKFVLTSNGKLRREKTLKKYDLI